MFHKWTHSFILRVESETIILSSTILVQVPESDRYKLQDSHSGNLHTRQDWDWW